MATQLDDTGTFLTGANAPFIAELYERYLENPALVDEQWRAYFDALQDDLPTLVNDNRGPSWAPRGTRVIGQQDEDMVAEAEGDAERFNSIFAEYSKAKEVTTRRMFLETMELVLQGATKVIIDQDGGGGVVPYLPLPELQNRAGGGN